MRRQFRNSEADSQLPQSPQRPVLPAELIQALRDGLAGSSSRRGLAPEARKAISTLCGAARKAGWTAEQLVVAVKDACYTSPEISGLTTTSERETFLATIVTGSIQEFYRPARAD